MFLLIGSMGGNDPGKAGFLTAVTAASPHGERKGPTGTQTDTA